MKSHHNNINNNKNQRKSELLIELFCISLDLYCIIINEFHKIFLLNKLSHCLKLPTAVIIHILPFANPPKINGPAIVTEVISVDNGKVIFTSKSTEDLIVKIFLSTPSAVIRFIPIALIVET